MVPRKLVASVLVSATFLSALLVLTVWVSLPHAATPPPVPSTLPEEPRALIKEEHSVFSSGWQSRSFFDNAYSKAGVIQAQTPHSLLVAHHLLVADRIAATFLTGIGSQPQTIVIVGPNHFSVGKSRAQTTVGTWETPYGDVTTDIAAVEKLLSANNQLRHEEDAFINEHSIAALTPFIARSYPNARIVPIILHESLSAEDAYILGETIATELPDALLVASVDMVHGQDATFTATWDAKILELINANGTCDSDWCTEDMPIDSNASLRVLFAFNKEKKSDQWNLLHHGSSLNMGAATEITDNVSHILGYFLTN